MPDPAADCHWLDANSSHDFSFAWQRLAYILHMNRRLFLRLLHGAAVGAVGAQVRNHAQFNRLPEHDDTGLVGGLIHMR
jgi:hypothetical protein